MLLCDVVLVADSIEVPAHRAVLAACSPYFYAMFTANLSESKAERIVLQEIDGKALAMLVEFVYTAEIHVTEENVQVRMGVKVEIVEGLNAYCVLYVDQHR